MVLIKIYLYQQSKQTRKWTNNIQVQNPHEHAKIEHSAKKEEQSAKKEIIRTRRSHLSKQGC